MSRTFYGLVALLFLCYVGGLILNPFLTLLVAAVTTVASGGITYLLIKILNRAALFDTPNARSMHKTPVPRGGGWSYVILLALGFALATTCDFGPKLINLDIRTFFSRDSFLLNIGQCFVIDKLTASLFSGFVLLALISWWDDCAGVRARLRLLAQFVAVALPLYFYPIENIFPDWVPVIAAFLFVLFSWVWFINLYNFMDGIDGITATETISISAVIIFLSLKFLALNYLTNDLVLLLAVILFSVSVGFLRYNWHPAQIFLGDVGSVTIGYILGFCLIHIAAVGYWHIALTMPLYYFVDSGVTLARRLIRGENIWEPHRSHLYQMAAQHSVRHDVVVMKIAACNLALGCIAIASLFWGKWLCLLAPIPVGILFAHFAKQARSVYLSTGNASHAFPSSRYERNRLAPPR